jgi:hypothetical protein
MKSSTTPSFWRAYRTLTPEIQAEARKAYQLWSANPRHPSLRFARKGDFWSVRITRDWRALAREHEGQVLLVLDWLARAVSTANQVITLLQEGS